MTAERPPMLYDYSGFPPESYAIQWPAPGEPSVAVRVRERGFGDTHALPVSESFDAWLRDTTRRDPRDRDARLLAWSSAPAARGAHPREEHLMPLMVVAGAAGDDVGRASFNGKIMGVRLSAHDFG